MSIGAEPSIDGLTTIRIMPLGDSITAGYGADVGGYREQLKNRLSSAGYNAVFVGSQSTFNPASDPGLAHEGHSGWRIPQITSIVTGSLDAVGTSASQIITTANPDVVMLMIGTNDMLGSNGMGIDPNLYRPLLDAIYAQKPTVRVIVLPFIYCSIFADVQGDNINYGGRDIRFINGQNVVVARQDGGLVQIITAYQRAGKRISFYDGMNQVITPANSHDTAVLTDGVHPTAATYVAMGNALVRAIQDVSIGVLDGSVTPTIPSGLIATANGAGLDLAWTRNSANETGFQIDVSSDPVFQNSITTVAAPAGSTGATINGLQANTQYFLRIRAVDAAGASANTTPSEATTGIGGTSSIATPTFSPAGGTYSSTQAVTLTCLTGGAAIHFTTDGSTPTASSPMFSVAISVASTTTIKAIATASGMIASAVASATYTISAPATVATPTFSPAGGAYTSTQAVTLTCSTGGTAIHFTTDGSTPTASSTTYSGAISVASTMTITAIGTASGMGASALASATYTFVAGAPPAHVDSATRHHCGIGSGLAVFALALLTLRYRIFLATGPCEPGRRLGTVAKNPARRPV
ncbi:MAG: chitobiase/beta-hexosaminidase C-terminal domain-containing protein [Planctomycetes bacterium]|nr:chitobiase/beta-hexosaminidase C-terminal domain-containing protein [Planctomycetota bacterium]